MSVVLCLSRISGREHMSVVLCLSRISGREHMSVVLCLSRISGREHMSVVLCLSRISGRERMSVVLCLKFKVYVLTTESLCPLAKNGSYTSTHVLHTHIYRTSCITLINNVSWTCDLLESHKYTKIKHKNDIKKCYSKFLWFNWKKGMFMVNVIRKLVSYIKKNLCMLIYTLSKEKIIILW